MNPSRKILHQSMLLIFRVKVPVLLVPKAGGDLLAVKEVLGQVLCTECALQEHSSTQEIGVLSVYEHRLLDVERLVPPEQVRGERTETVGERVELQEADGQPHGHAGYALYQKPRDLKSDDR